MRLLRWSVVGNLRDLVGSAVKPQVEDDAQESRSGKESRAIGRVEDSGLQLSPAPQLHEEPESYEIYAVRSKLGGWLP
jgi:hypothetical protein